MDRLASSAGSRSSAVRPTASACSRAGVILTIMILPTIVTISREVIRPSRASQREAMFALGATRWETIRRAVVPYARSGIIGAVILGLGRALGETMAVTMVIGNKDAIPTRLFDQAQTIASKIATTFSEAPRRAADLEPDRPRADPAGHDHRS